MTNLIERYGKHTWKNGTSRINGKDAVTGETIVFGEPVYISDRGVHVLPSTWEKHFFFSTSTTTKKEVKANIFTSRERHADRYTDEEKRQGLHKKDVRVRMEEWIEGEI